jgi:predicted  nucleic acid-binding Zn-ribbon protein
MFTASVESVSMPRPKYVQNTFGQLPEMVVDIVANINGERREFKQVPSNNAIADFGPDTFVLSDSKDSLMNYVSSMLQSSKNIVNSVEKHKSLITQYEQVIADLNPASANESAVKELREQVVGMQSQMGEILSLLKSGGIKQQ